MAFDLFDTNSVRARETELQIDDKTKLVYKHSIIKKAIGVPQGILIDLVIDTTQGIAIGLVVDYLLNKLKKHKIKSVKINYMEINFNDKGDFERVIHEQIEKSY